MVRGKKVTSKMFHVFLRKRGWMKIVEAALAVMIISGVLITIYSSQPKRGDYSDEVVNFQKQILLDFSTQRNLRVDVLNSDNPSNFSELNNYVKSRIPNYLNFSLKICELANPPLPCKNDNYINTLDKNIYIDEVIVSAEIDEYKPKKVRLFIWEK